MADAATRALAEPAAGQAPWPTRAAEGAAPGLLALMLGLGLHRVFLVNINWDEFYYLSLVHDHLRGVLANPLQTVHVHLFAWLPRLGDEVAQVIGARVALYLLGLGSAALIYATARRFVPPGAALFPVLLYVSFSYVVDHGASFRADPVCAFLFLAALFLLSSEDRGTASLLGAAGATALAGLVSIKSAFYLPTLALVLLAPGLRPGARGRSLREAALFGLACAGLFAALYALHARTLAAAPALAVEGYAAGAAAKTVSLAVLLPRSYDLVRALEQNAVFWLFAAGGLWLSARDLMRRTTRPRGAVLVSLALPLLALAVYRNAFAYFYVFLLAPVAILAGPSAEALLRGARRAGARAAPAALAGALIVAGLGFAAHYVKRLPGQIEAQGELIALVHRLFPEPVPYLDRSAMIASFPWTGFLMSTWGMEAYRARGRPIMHDLLARRQPRFVIANSPALALDRAQDPAQDASPYRLLAEDFAVLRANYVHHWGALFVAGKAFELVPGGPAQDFEILVAGTYTLEAGAALRIDGAAVRPGEPVALAPGRHAIAPGPMGGRAVLRWGRDLERPARAPSPQPIFYAF